MLRQESGDIGSRHGTSPLATAPLQCPENPRDPNRASKRLLAFEGWQARTSRDRGWLLAIRMPFLGSRTLEHRRRRALASCGLGGFLDTRPWRLDSSGHRRQGTARRQRGQAPLTPRGGDSFAGGALAGASKGAAWGPWAPSGHPIAPPLCSRPLDRAPSTAPHAVDPSGGHPIANPFRFRPSTGARSKAFLRHRPLARAPDRNPLAFPTREPRATPPSGASPLSWPPPRSIRRSRPTLRPSLPTLVPVRTHPLAT